jgi:hypothetical protein
MSINLPTSEIALPIAPSAKPFQIELDSIAAFARSEVLASLSLIYSAPL